MTLNPRALPLAFFVLLSAVCGATAQTAGPDEAIRPNGGIAQKTLLTPAQRNAIYNAVIRQKVPTSSHGITAVVGTPVPPSVLLSDLPSSDVMDGIGRESSNTPRWKAMLWWSTRSECGSSMSSTAG